MDADRSLYDRALTDHNGVVRRGLLPDLDVDFAVVAQKAGELGAHTTGLVRLVLAWAWRADVGTEEARCVVLDAAETGDVLFELGVYLLFHV